MRHSYYGNHLGRRTNQAKALYRSLMATMLIKGRMETTKSKAKVVQPDIERLINLAKTDSVANRRMAARALGTDRLTNRLFKEIGPAFEGVSSGFTRIIRLGQRFSDTAEMVIFELTRLPQPGTGGQARMPVEVVTGEVVGNKTNKTSKTVTKIKKNDKSN